MVIRANKDAQRRSDSGFTLIEVMLVVIIIGILAGMTVLNISKVSRSAVVAACKSDWKTVDNAFKAYQNDNKNNPTDTSPSTLTDEDFYSSPSTSTLVKNGYMGTLTAVNQGKSAYKIGILFKTSPAYLIVVNDADLTKRLAATGAESAVTECDLIP